MLRAPVHAPLATDADREAALDRLREAAIDGRLTFDELAERADRAHRARTQPELAAVIRDLGRPPVPPERHRAVLRTLRRRGHWRPAPSSRFTTVLGTVTLDLRGAELRGPVLDLEVVPVFGTVRVEVPVGVEIRVRDGGVLTGCRVLLDGPPPDPGAPVVRVHVRGFCGSAEIRCRPRLADHVRDGIRRLLDRHVWARP